MKIDIRYRPAYALGVITLVGPGRVLMQTRSADAFLAWLIPQIPQSSSGSN